MSLDSIADRFAKLRAMREKLCKQETSWKEAFQARDWVVSELQSFKALILHEASTQDDLINRIDDLLCVLAPSQDDGCNDD